MQTKVERYIKEQGMLKQGSQVVAAVSGGADSVCLLHILVSLQIKMGLKLQIVHVHHGLRGEEADRDAQFVRELSEEWKVPCLVVYRDAAGYARQNGLSVEEAGRELRYQVFREVADQMKNGRIAVAHHQDDQAETILHNLFRGSGIRGLGGMAPIRENIIRPLLCVSRQEILEYLNEKGIPYCVDSTNSCVDYTRNKLRHQVIPIVCQEVNSAAVRHITASGEYLRQAEEYFNQEAGRIWREHRQIGKMLESGSSGSIQNIPEDNLQNRTDWQSRELGGEKERKGIHAEIITSLPDIMQGYVAMEMIGEMTDSRKDITSRHIDMVLDIARKGTGRNSSLPHGIRVYKEYDMVWMEKLEDIERQPEKGEAQNQESDKRNREVVSQKTDSEKLPEFSVPGTAVCHLPPPFTAECLPAAFLMEKYHKIPENKYTKWFDYDKIKGTLSVRVRKTGDYFTLKDGRRKTIKAFMIDEKIPRPERDKILLLAEGQHILWIVGYRISEFYKITDETKQILRVRMDGGKEHEG